MATLVRGAWCVDRYSASTVHEVTVQLHASTLALHASTLAPSPLHPFILYNVPMPPALHLAWHASPGSPAIVSPVAWPGVIGQPARLAVAGRLEVAVEPDRLELSAAAGPGTVHFQRLADATTRPLPAELGALPLAPGDVYAAVVGAASPALGLAAARFIHLRDYFNADALASALLAHLLAEAPGSVGAVPGAPALGVLVIECR
jgi:hypothetical protein